MTLIKQVVNDAVLPSPQYCSCVQELKYGNSDRTTVRWWYSAAMTKFQKLYIMVCEEYRSVCPFVRIGSSPPRKRVCLPLEPKGGRSITPLHAGKGVRGPVRTIGKKAWPSVYFVMVRVSQRDVVYLGWPITPSYISPNGGEGGRCGVSVSVDDNSCALGAQINFGDLTPYLTYGDGVLGKK